jgi:adenylate kinase family enzyme
MEKILIIGIPGSGKSTFANKLGKILNREVIHLDKFYRKSGWVVAYTKSEWLELVKNLVSKKQWIIDGNYHNTLDIRLSASDIVVFLNFNKLLCLYRIFARCYKKDHLLDIDKAEGDRNRISWDLIKKVILYPRKETLEKLKNYKNIKKIFIAKNDKEAENLLKRLSEK